jgi:S1-C subfamily serine protease
MSLPETFETVRWSVVAFASKVVANAFGQKPIFPPIIGTGFVVDPRGLVATNRHVVEALLRLPQNPKTGAPSGMAIVWTQVQREPGGQALPILFVDVKEGGFLGSFSSATPFYGEPVPDIAFVQLNIQNLPALPLATEENSWAVGSAVGTVGFPLGTPPLTLYGKVNQIAPFLRHGIISSVYPFPCAFPHGLTIDVTTQGGASGSPVFLADRPIVIGMIEAIVKEAPNITIAVPSNLVACALADYTRGKELEIAGVPTLEELVRQSERSGPTDELQWESLVVVRRASN